MDNANTELVPKGEDFKAQIKELKDCDCLSCNRRMELEKIINKCIDERLKRHFGLMRKKS